jgi:branched-chain amino acid transport system substrate-binding protein
MHRRVAYSARPGCLVQDLHSAGYNATVFGNDETNADDTFSKLAGDLADGTIRAVLTSDLHPSPELTSFREEYKNRFNIDPTPFAETSYDSIMMLSQVVNDTKSTKPADLQKGFNSVKGVQGHHRRPRLLGEEPHHDQRRAADAGQI